MEGFDDLRPICDTKTLGDLRRCLVYSHMKSMCHKLLACSWIHHTKAASQLHSYRIHALLHSARGHTSQKATQSAGQVNAAAEAAG